MRTVGTRNGVLSRSLRKADRATCRRALSISLWFEENVLGRPNPFLQHLPKASDSDYTFSLPWKSLKPNHADKASTEILKDLQEGLSTLDDSPSPKSLSELQSKWFAWQAPSSTYGQCLTVLALSAYPPSVQVQWESAYKSWTRQKFDVSKNVLTTTSDAPSVVPKWFDPELLMQNDQTSGTLQQQRWFKYWQLETGATLSSEQRDVWSKWQTALSNIRDHWMDVKPSQSREWLPLLYSHIGSRQALAKDVWGAKNAAEQALGLRYGQASFISHLHEAVSEKLEPLVMLGIEQPQDRRVKNLLRERIFVMEAVEFVLEKLCADVFGLQITWSKQPADAWHTDVRTLHISSGKDSEGTSEPVKESLVYLDLFERDGKARLSATVPLSPGTTVVSMNLKPPIWDTDPVLMSFEDLLDFFHEMGHVLQQFAASDTGDMGIQPSFPLDWAEVLPKFMEQWLWDPTFLKSLLVASGDLLDDEAVAVLYNQARRAKADDLARQTFYSATEWEIFSDYNIQAKETETIMALAQRLARQHIPHDVPHPTDLGALHHIADANIRDMEQVALYRYIWAEVVAANVFEETKASYEADKSLPTDALVRHLCVPTSLESLTSELSRGELRVDALWRRYRLLD